MQPTFTRGFFLGQFSIFALAVVLKLFLDTGPAQIAAAGIDTPPVLQPTTPIDWEPTHIEPESTEWLNALLHQVRIYY